MNLEFGELNQLEKKLKTIQENTGKLAEMKQEVHTDDLFPDSYVQMYTSFSSFNELLKAAGYTGQSQEEFEQFVETELDPYLAKHSQLTTWKEFQDKAVAAYVGRHLGL
ncbi:hypothetical protein [Paenibacillus dakarensis]|uniref:hypothetical protein n=1 Tax=Paenibacillus dakarensis TaxID=1527293 RepID=UPI0006D5799E|nr:hypothetical protein [Paenibacillus dakarensis]